MNYCYNCGQENHDKRVTVGLLVKDLLAESWTLDNKALKSLWPLITKPGFLTREFMNGKRVSYNKPLRLYLFISFVYFLLSNVVGGGGETVLQLGGADSTATEQPYINLTTQPTNNDTVLAPENSLTSYLRSKEKAVNEVENRLRMKQQIEDNWPLFFFALIPALALWMYILFYKKEYFYVDSFVFSLHGQTFVFVLMCFLLIIERFTASDMPRLAMAVGVFAYFVVAAKRVYEVSYGGAIVRLIGVGLLHILTALVFLVAYAFILLEVVV